MVNFKFELVEEVHPEEQSDDPGFEVFKDEGDEWHVPTQATLDSENENDNENES